MSERKEYKFSDFVEINPTVSMKGNEMYSFVEMKDLQDGNKFCFPSVERSPSSGTRFKEGDTLFARITPCLENGKICKVKGLKNGIGFGSTEFHVFRGKENVSNNDFVFYLSRWDEVRGYAESRFEGTSGRQRVPKNCFDNLFLNLPPLPEQTAIAEVLSSLDDKIDLLHRQNKTLEQLAETLFRQWFVVEVEETNTTTLADYVESANTGLDAIKRAPIIEVETGIKCLRIQDISQGKTIDRWGNSKVEENNFKKFQLRRDDIIMARTCSPGINLFIREDLPAVFNNGLVRIRAKKDKVHPILLNYLFKTREFIGHIDGISGGTSVQLNMQVGDLLSYEFSFPPIEKQNEIIQYFFSIDDKIFYNQNQIRTLTQLRDTLLPKLMSGEAKINL
jgi:type I restriction enzyme, S subunit